MCWNWIDLSRIPRILTNNSTMSRSGWMHEMYETVTPTSFRCYCSNALKWMGKVYWCEWRPQRDSFIQVHSFIHLFIYSFIHLITPSLGRKLTLPISLLSIRICLRSCSRRSFCGGFIWKHWPAKLGQDEAVLERHGESYQRRPR